MKELRRLLSEKILVSRIVGFLVCTSLAALSTWYFYGDSRRTAVPLFFVVVVAATAAFWGYRAAIAGMLSASALFAFLLFPPLGSWSVASESARRNLSWMLLFGLISAFFLSRSFDRRTHHRDQHRDMPHKNEGGGAGTC